MGKAFLRSTRICLLGGKTDGGEEFQVGPIVQGLGGERRDVEGGGDHHDEITGKAHGGKLLPDEVGERDAGLGEIQVADIALHEEMERDLGGDDGVFFTLPARKRSSAEATALAWRRAEA